MDKPHIVTASELQRSSGKVWRRVAQDSQHLIVERQGQRVAALVPYPEYEALLRPRASAAHRQHTGVRLGRGPSSKVWPRRISPGTLKPPRDRSLRNAIDVPAPSARGRMMVAANVLWAGSLWPPWLSEVPQRGQRGDIQLVLTPFLLSNE